MLESTADRIGIRRRVLWVTWLRFLPLALPPDDSVPTSTSTPEPPGLVTSLIRVVVLAGVLVFVVGGAFFYQQAAKTRAKEFSVASAQLGASNKRVQALERELTAQRAAAAPQQTAVAQQAAAAATAHWQQVVAEYALDKALIRKVAPDVDWVAVQKSVVAVPPGRRLTAILTALRLARTTIRYKDGGLTPESGMDPGRFLDYVLQRSGFAATPISVDRRATEALMERFSARTETPRPGDFVFYDTTTCGGKGNTGCFYLTPGEGGHGVCVGLIHRDDVLQVKDTASFDSRDCKFIGYFAVPYEEGHTP
jgi:hypothetical protein